MDIDLIGVLIVGLGMWMFSDGVYSWTLYLNAPSYEGSEKQTFWRDHWVRFVRTLCGIALVYLGYLLVVYQGG